MRRRMTGWVHRLVMLALLGSAPLPAAAQPIAGSLEAGLQSLAQALLSGTPVTQRPALSVMPFPAADQSCTVLSVFVVDELTTTLITAVQPRPRLVERQQLETIVAQNRLNEFMTDPEQRRRVGGLLNIGALLVGTYAVIGDRVRVNARLVAIDTGETTAAAAVSIPRTSELTELLRQGAGRGRNCMSDAGPRASRPAAIGSTAPPQPAFSDAACEEQEGLRACVRNLRRSGQETNLVVEVENTGSGPIALAVVGPAPSLMDNGGTVYEAKQISGLPVCGKKLEGRPMEASNQQMCLVSDYHLARAAFRPVPPGARIGLSMKLRAVDAPVSEMFTLAAALAVLPRLPTSMPAQQAHAMQARLHLVTLPDLRPSP